MISVVTTAVPAKTLHRGHPIPSVLTRTSVSHLIMLLSFLRQVCNTSLPRPHLPLRGGTIGMQPFRIKHDKSQVHDCCMSGIHHKKTDCGDIKSIWNVDNLKLKHLTSAWKNSSRSYNKSWKQKRMGNCRINFVYSAQVWEYKIFTNNSSFLPAQLLCRKYCKKGPKRATQAKRASCFHPIQTTFLPIVSW